MSAAIHLAAIERGYNEVTNTQLWEHANNHTGTKGRMEKRHMMEILKGIEPPWTDALTLRYHVRDVHAMQHCVDALTSLTCRQQQLVDWPVLREQEPQF